MADRFFVLAGRQWIDAGTGLAVAIRVEPAGSRSEQLAWSLQCETLANLRHDLINPLVDFGAVDCDRRFEAYAQRGAVRAAGRAGAQVLEHGVRFLRSHDIALPPASAALALRAVVPGPAMRSRPVGLALQRRGAYEAIVDSLDVAHPVGVARVVVAGPSHSGLRTLRTLVARAARLHGYVPVAASLLGRVSWITGVLMDRHVCVLAGDGVDAGAAVAAFLARAGAASARRHLVVDFVRRPAGRVVHMDRMGVAAMTAMIYVDEETGPSPGELFAAARQAEGRPGLFVACLAGGHTIEPSLTALVARETAPAYGLEPGGPPGAATGRLSEWLRRAGARAERLAGIGRHAAARRVLARSMRVLAGRGARDAAGECGLQLGRLWLDRGLTVEAIAAFSEVRDLTTSTGAGIAATIGIGAARLLQARFADAEGALRGAVAAAREAHDASLQGRAAAHLADCLCRQSRYDEAEVALDEAVPPTDASAVAAMEAVRARVHLGRGRIPPATAAARLALEHALRTSDPRLIVSGYDVVARAHAAAGDLAAARLALDAATRVARQAHLSLDVLRLHVARTELLTASRLTAPPAGLPHARGLPPLLRADLERVTRRPAGVESVPADPPTDLEAMLVIAQAAEDDTRAVEKICETVLRQIGARTVVVIARPPETRQLAVAGKAWHEPSAALRVLAGESRVVAEPAIEPCQAAEPVRYVGELVAAVACRFAAGTPVHPGRTTALLRSAALAIAPAVRGLLDRVALASVEPAPGDLLGDSAAARALRDAIARAARAPFPVLIEGESGSGKELVARGIHRLGPRRERRFCAVNCAALSDDLLEAELFGHARGAFTGAIGERAGLFEDADGGTLFLDEVGELSPRAQAKLLRVLQDGEVRRVGENVARRVDVRIVAATNRRLESETAAGRFRADLRFRLDVVRLEVPPLRERTDDVPMLAARFWSEAASRVGSHATLSPETLAALARYDWPGNVRELQNVMAWMAVQSPLRGRVGPAALPAHVAGAAVPIASTFEAAREAFERRFVRAALASANGQRGRAAEALGVTRQGLAKMLRRLHIEAP